MEKLNFTYDYEGKTVAEFDSESEMYKELINIAIKELQKIKDIKGCIYDSTLSINNKENFKDDMKIFMSCDIAIKTLNALARKTNE